jgi:hypothetical protein
MMYCRVSTERADNRSLAHLPFLVDVTLGKAALHHLGVQVIQHPLDFPDPPFAVANVVRPVVRDEVEQLGVEIVERFVAPQCGASESDEGPGRKRVLGVSLSCVTS